MYKVRYMSNDHYKDAVSKDLVRSFLLARAI